MNEILLLQRMEPVSSHVQSREGEQYQPDRFILKSLFSAVCK